MKTGPGFSREIHREAGSGRARNDKPNVKRLVQVCGFVFLKNDLTAGAITSSKYGVRSFTPQLLFPCEDGCVSARRNAFCPFIETVTE